MSVPSSLEMQQQEQTRPRPSVQPSLLSSVPTGLEIPPQPNI